MDEGSPKAALRRALRRVDELGAPLGAGVGVGLGVLAGGGAVYLGGAGGAALGGAALCGAVALVVTARPLALRAEEVAPRTEEPPERQAQAEAPTQELAPRADAPPERQEAQAETPTQEFAPRADAPPERQETQAEAPPAPAPNVAPEPPPAQRAARSLVEPLEMIELPGGAFLMGSEDPRSYAHERPVHRVEVAAFAMGKTAVTQRLYREVMGENPGSPRRDDLPVNCVNWYQAVAFCNRMSKRMGLAPCYDFRDQEVTLRELLRPTPERQAGNHDYRGQEVTLLPGADGYRLPTEAEWEYANRAGTATEYSFGDDEARLEEYAWFRGNAGGTVHPVGQKKPNPWGLHDMHGNVWEWCWDWFGRYMTKDDKVARVVRGGSFANGPGDLRAACRSRNQPETRYRSLGFRCVRGSVR